MRTFVPTESVLATSSMLPAGSGSKTPPKKTWASNNARPKGPCGQRFDPFLDGRGFVEIDASVTICAAGGVHGHVRVSGRGLRRLGGPSGDTAKYMSGGLKPVAELSEIMPARRAQNGEAQATPAGVSCILFISSCTGIGYLPVKQPLQ